MSSENIKPLTVKLLKLQNQINILQNQINQLKEQRNQIERLLINDLHRNNIDRINLQNKKLIICNECNYTPLSYKYLEQQLNSLFPNEGPKVKAMIKYMKGNRGKTVNQTIKIK